MDELNEYLNKWSLSSPTLIEESKTSTLYRVQSHSGLKILKILTEIGKKYEQASFEVLRVLDGQGVVRIYQFDDDACLLEYLDGLSLSESFTNLGDETACEIICEVTDHIHRFQGVTPIGIPNLNQQFESLFTVAKSTENTLLIKAAKLAQYLVDTESHKKLLHGDIHHNNIKYCSSRGWLAFDPQSVYAESTYDLANMFFNPMGLQRLTENTDRMQELAEICAEKKKINAKRVLQFAFAHGGLSISWLIEDGKNPERRMRILNLMNTIVPWSSV